MSNKKILGDFKNKNNSFKDFAMLWEGDEKFIECCFGYRRGIDFDFLPNGWLTFPESFFDTMQNPNCIKIAVPQGEQIVKNIDDKRYEIYSEEDFYKKYEQQRI